MLFLSIIVVYVYNDVPTLWFQLSISYSSQNRYFEQQFELAHVIRLPMFLRMPAAAEDFRIILERNKER